MATTVPPTTSLNDPDVMFTEDVLADPTVAPQLFDSTSVPKIRVYARGKGPGNPDIVTERTEAYVLSWERRDPSVWE
jgi:hypothetical protein